jgi:hypothetical protein
MSKEKETRRKAPRRLPIQVGASYRSGCAPEPEHFHVGHAVYDVVEIVDRWYEGPPHAGRPIQHYYKVRSRGGSLFLIAHADGTDAWFLLKAFGPEDPT